jgi:DNA-binding transcriptional regulator GbsR (MarR family)
MEINDGKRRFIESWGNLASSWGINRSMGQVHALLLISPIELTTDDLMSELGISRGAACMNLKDLLEWGLIEKKWRPGDRKEYFLAEKDMWKVMRQIIINRKKKELEPMLNLLDELAAVESKCPDSDSFCKVMKDLQAFSHKANSTLDAMTRTDSGFLMRVFMQLAR